LYGVSVKIQILTNLHPSNWVGFLPSKKVKLLSSIYIILTSLIYLVGLAFNSTLIRCNLVYYSKFRHKRIFMVQKAPMAHRRWSQEQYTSKQSVINLMIKSRLNSPSPITVPDTTLSYSTTPPKSFIYKSRPFFYFSNDLNVISFVRYKLPVCISLT